MKASWNCWGGVLIYHLKYSRRFGLGPPKPFGSPLLSSVRPERQAELRFVLAKISNSAQATISRDYTEAKRSVQSMQRGNKLNEAALLLFAIANRYEHVVVALSTLASAPFELVDHLMHGDRIDALLIPRRFKSEVQQVSIDGLAE